MTAAIVARARPLSPLQASMLVAALRSRVDPYLRQTAVRLQGRLDVPAFQSAWSAVIARHSALRTAFEWRGVESAGQRVCPSAQLPCRIIDCRNLTETEQEAWRQRVLAEDRTHGLPLDRAPLMRLALLQLADDEWYALWTYHHLILDGWSRPLVFRDLSAHYRAARVTEPASFGASPQYGAYLDWLEQQDRPAATIFWGKALQACDGTSLCGRDAAVHDLKSAGRYTILTPEQLSALADAARRSRVTMGTAICGAWSLLLGQLLGVRDVVFGICSSGRAADVPSIEQIVGPLMNVVPLRVQLPAEMPAMDFLRGVQSQMQAVQRYAYVSLPEIQRQSRVPQDRPLFDTLVNFQRVSNVDPERAPGMSFAGIKSEFFEQHTNPLVLQVLHGRGLAVRLDWQLARVNSDTASAMLDAVLDMTAALLAAPQRRLVDVPEAAVDWRPPAAAVSAPRVANDRATGCDTDGGATDGRAVGMSRGKGVPAAFQQELASIWMDVLQVTHVAPGDSFFALGGHSLLANAVAARVERRLGIEVPITLLFDAPTFAEFAVAIWQLDAAAQRPTR